MKKLGGIIIRELITIKRDIPALILLFVLPLFLVIVVTLTEQKALSRVEQSEIEIIIVNEDSSSLGKEINEGFKGSGYFRVINQRKGKNITEKEAIELVKKGIYQAGIIVPKSTSDSALSASHVFAKKSLGADSELSENSSEKIIPSRVRVYIDPAISESYRASVVNSLRMIVQAAEFKLLFLSYMSEMQSRLNEQYKQQLKKELDIRMNNAKLSLIEEMRKSGNMSMANFKPKPDSQLFSELPMQNFTPSDSFNWEPGKIIGITEEYAMSERSVIKPSVVQNNVPGFTLFAMFFIVIPLSGSIIIEKSEGAFNRLKTLPVSYLTLLTGKILVYLMVCILQFAMLLFMGIKFFPWIDLPVLVPGNHYDAIITAVLASSLAATGFGLLIGTIARTHAQAAMFGSSMVVILSILGGVFIPVHLMPASMEMISNISPVRWGIDSFLSIFVREGNMISVLPDVVKLVSFFVVSLLISLNSFVKRK